LPHPVCFIEIRLWVSEARGRGKNRRFPYYFGYWLLHQLILWIHPSLIAVIIQKLTFIVLSNEHLATESGTVQGKGRGTYPSDV